MSNWPQYAMGTIIFGNLIYHLVTDQKVASTSDRVGAVLGSFTVFGMYAGILWAGGFWNVLFATN